MLQKEAADRMWAVKYQNQKLQCLEHLYTKCFQSEHMSCGILQLFLSKTCSGFRSHTHEKTLQQFYLPR